MIHNHRDKKLLNVRNDEWKFLLYTCIQVMHDFNSVYFYPPPEYNDMVINTYVVMWVYCIWQ